MFYTFLFSDNQKKDLVESNHFIKIKPKVEFFNESLNRVALYAILVYCFHCTRGDQSSSMFHEEARHLMRTIKKALVKAAYLLRESFGRKLYAKTRFLCEKLHENMESKVSSADKVIKIIIEEFHPCFIDEVFTLLSQSMPNSMGLPLLSSLNLIHQTSFLNPNDQRRLSEETFKTALENLNVNLTVRKGQQVKEIGRRGRVNVLIREDVQSRYYLIEIALFLEWNQIIQVQN